MDLLLLDVVTGKKTGLAATVRRALMALRRSGVPHCVIGATALAVRGLPRMTRDLDVTVLLDDGEAAVAALLDAGLVATTPVGSPGEPEPMVVFLDQKTGVEVDLLIAAGDPEATTIERAERAKVLGTLAPVATLENLLLLYLYSNQPRHLGDFAAIVTSGRADLGLAERTLAMMHPEMLGEWQRRVAVAKAPPPPPPRPPTRRRRRR